MLGGQKVNSIRLSIMLSPLQPLDEIQPNFMCELLTSMGRATAPILAPPPGEESKGHISLNFNYKDFYTKLFASSHKYKYKTYQMEISFCGLGHGPGVGLGGAGGSKNVSQGFAMSHVLLLSSDK